MNIFNTIFSTCFFGCILTVSSPVFAEESQPESVSAEEQVDGVIPPIENGFVYQNSFFYRHNPLGIGDVLSFGYRKKLGSKPKSDVLFGNAHIYTGFDLLSFGSINLLEGVVLVEPIAILQLRASFAQFFTSRDGNPDLLYDLSIFNNSTKAFASIPGAGLSSSSILKLQAQIRLPVGPLILRNTVLFRKFLGMNNFENRPYFYDFNYDVILEANGMLVHNDLDLLYMKSKNPWVLGVRHTITQPLNTHPDVGSGQNQRLGPLMAWTFKNKPNRNHYRDHYVLLLSQIYLQHPLRASDSTYEGEFDLEQDPFLYTTSRLSPYIGFIWGFGGQFAKK